MRRFLHGMAILVWAVAAAQARPMAEAPPDGFSGAQYIDSGGCVHRRDGDRWVALRDDHGAAVCGYPPTRAVRAPGTAGLPRPDPGPTPSEALAMVLAEGLRNGDLASARDAAPVAQGLPEDGSRVGAALAPRPAAAKVALIAPPAGAAQTAAPGAGQDVPRRASDPGSEFGALIEAAPVVQAALAAPASGRSGDLCALLGYRTDEMAAAAATPGGDPAQGLCAGIAAPPLAPVLIADAAAARPPADAPATAVAAPQAPAPQTPAPSPRAAGAPARPDPASRALAAPRTAAASQARRPAPPAPDASAPDASGPDASGPELIPPGARYVQVGLYADPGRAAGVIRTLADRGLPVARARPASGSPGEAVLAGPFTDRQTLIAALNSLRGSGFPAARAR